MQRQGEMKRKESVFFIVQYTCDNMDVRNEWKHTDYQKEY